MPVCQPPESESEEESVDADESEEDVGEEVDAEEITARRVTVRRMTVRKMTVRRMTVRRHETAMVTVTGRGGVDNAQGASQCCRGVVRVGDARLVLISARWVDGSYIVTG
jgi:hypothetical protein